MEGIRKAFNVAASRSFEQDPRFGVCVLSEIASRALSPAVNDPGTAIDILSRGARMLAVWSDHYANSPEPGGQAGIRFPNVHVPPVELDELFDDFFIPIARDGAGIVEVGIHLQKMLQTLACLGDDRYRKAAARHSAQALARAELVLKMTDDLVRVQQSAARVAKAIATLMASDKTPTWRECGANLDHAGRRIFWRQGGERNAPALVLIHGFPTSSSDWAPVWRELEKDYRLVALDMLGFGYSSKPVGHHYSIFEQADIHEALLTHLGIGDYHALAHDYGDTVAQELLARQLESAPAAGLRSVCFLNGGLFPETHRPLPIQKLLMSPIGPLVARLSTRRSLGAEALRRALQPLTDHNRWSVR